MVATRREPYVFLVNLPGQEALEFPVDIDPTVPLMENWLQVIAESKGTLHEIPVAQPNADGHENPIKWTFAWLSSDDDSGKSEELSPVQSLEDQGVFRGSEIHVTDDSRTG